MDHSRNGKKGCSMQLVLLYYRFAQFYDTLQEGYKLTSKFRAKMTRQWVRAVIRCRECILPSSSTGVPSSTGKV